MMRKLLYILFALFCGTATVNAWAFTVGYLNYSVNDDGASVTVTGHINGEDATGSIVIPNTVTYNGNSYPVTAIGRYAFKHHRQLDGTLTIGNNVSDIGYGAFIGCNNLHGILNIPNSVTNIDAHAFRDCDGFTGSLTIPNSVTTIGVCAFEQCDGFNGTLTIGRSVTSIGEAAFQLCQNFTRAVCWAEEPPVLEASQGNFPWSVCYYEFYGFGCQSVIVPCGSKTAYENSPWHSSTYSFETIIQNCEIVAEFDDQTSAVYPNPTSGKVVIKAENIQNISIYNILGSKIIESAASGNIFEYDFSNQETGIYLIIIETQDGVLKKTLCFSKN